MNAPFTRPTGILALNATATVLLGLFYSSEVSDGLRARTAEVSAFADLPNIGFAAAALAATLLGAGITVAGTLQKRDGSWKGYRVMPVLVVLIVFADLFVLSADKVPMGAPDRVALAISALAQRASEGSSAEGVLARREPLEEFVKSLGPPPLLVRGVRRPRWELSLRPNCTGAASELAGDGPGTLIYCVSADGHHAWVSAVAFPREQRFGPSGLFTVAGVPFSAEVRALPAEEASGADDGEAVALDEDGGFVAAP